MSDPKDKRFKITIGYSVRDENGDFFDSGLVYHDAPRRVLQGIHEVMLKHAATMQEALRPLMEDLTDLGHADLVVEGTPPVEVEKLKEQFRGKGHKKK